MGPVTDGTPRPGPPSPSGPRRPLETAPEGSASTWTTPGDGGGSLARIGLGRVPDASAVAENSCHGRRWTKTGQEGDGLSFRG